MTWNTLKRLRGLVSGILAVSLFCAQAPLDGGLGEAVLSGDAPVIALDADAGIILELRSGQFQAVDGQTYTVVGGMYASASETKRLDEERQELIAKNQSLTSTSPPPAAVGSWIGYAIVGAVFLGGGVALGYFLKK